MIETFTDSERALLAPFVTNLDSPVFAVRNLPEEVVAVLFAYYSRSTDSLRRNLLTLLQTGDLDLAGGGATSTAGEADNDHLARARDKARQFHEKWVVGYGHGSVAEHACVHLALENVSIIASKLIEDTRLASYTEKSTRYVPFDVDKMYYPLELAGNQALADEYAATLKALLDAYAGWTPDIVAQIKSRVPRTEKQTERGYDNACRASAFDVLRYLLPSATFTNIGLTINARALESMISKLLSQPLPEGRLLGEAIKTEAQHIVPTLLKYADHNSYLAERHSWSFGEVHTVDRRGNVVNTGTEKSGSVMIQPGIVKLVQADSNTDDRLVAALLYGNSTASMDELEVVVRAMSTLDKKSIVETCLAGRGKHDAFPRALERIFCTVEMTMDYGAYRDIQRHRMATQTTQGPDPKFGFAMPTEVELFGYADQYITLMDRCSRTYDRLVDAGYELHAAYALPLATRMRVLFTWNLREVTHFVELRSSRQGHPSYRQIAQEVFRVVEAAFPLVARHMRPNMKKYDLTRD